jgi:L-glyceraldehyde 3-phosphate reductase
VRRVRALSQVAEARGQSMAQLAIAWTLRDERVTSAIMGASRPEQVTECVAAASNTAFSAEELDRIDAALALD